jgi:hypothetical protein
VTPTVIDVTFKPPLPTAGKALDVIVEFDVYPNVFDYKIDVTYPGGFVDVSGGKSLTTDSAVVVQSAAVRGRLRHLFSVNAGTATVDRHKLDVTVTPRDKSGAPLTNPPRVKEIVSVYVLDGSGGGTASVDANKWNAVKENFDDMVGNKLKGAVDSIAAQLRAANTNGIRLASTADTRAANPARAAFWTSIRQGADALSFNNYMTFMDSTFCAPFGLPGNMRMPFSQVDTYLRLKAFTELFLLTRAGVLMAPPAGGQLSALQANNVPNGFFGAMGQGSAAVLNQIVAARPYLQIVLQNNDVFQDAAVLDDICHRLRYPVLIELIWSYWHEESMMVQSLRAIRDRFQNRTRLSGPDPLAQLEMDPLRPLNNIFWGYVQDEQHRLGLKQRSYEYLHHYGIGLEGRAVGTLRPADSRKRFLQAFHTLLYQCVQFYRLADDITVVANANNVLWALKDLHLLLAEGAHNQFGDLPWNARLEMLMEQWILSRPEIQDFLRARRMVPYPEAWMGTVDTMKTLQGWNGTNVIHFRDLGVFGEQVLLSVREGGVVGVGGWSTINDPAEAAAFAITWRPEIEGYINAYRAVTGVDVAQDPSDPRFLAERDTAPSVHLRRRLAAGAR